MEDCERLGPVLCQQLGQLAKEVKLATTQAEACQLLVEFGPELVLLDISLPDGSGVAVLEQLGAQVRAPAVVVLSALESPLVAFRLAQMGACAWLPKPVTADELRAAVEQALSHIPDLTPQLRTAVGRIAVRDLETQVRATMLQEALVRSQGSRRGAARLLSVSRQLLQHMLKAMDIHA